MFHFRCSYFLTNVLEKCVSHHLCAGFVVRYTRTSVVIDQRYADARRIKTPIKNKSK